MRSGTLRLMTASLLCNAVLIGCVLWAASTGLSLFVILPLFLAVSIGEFLLWKAFLWPGRRERDTTTDRRIDVLGAVATRRRSSIMDETTGLYTRWYFDRRIDEEAARCTRYKHSMAVVVLRVDVVDLTTFSLDGWQKRSLEAAQRAAKVVREVDISAALSPFEFAICLVHCDRQGAYHALDRMMSQLPDYNCEAGVAVFPDEGHEPSTLVELAHARMQPLRNGSNLRTSA